MTKEASRARTDSEEYWELFDHSTTCSGPPGPTIGGEQLRVCSALEHRGLLCTCGAEHYNTTPLGHDAMRIIDATRALEGTGSSRPKPGVGPVAPLCGT
jgi:hypothetical protein